MRGIDPRKEIKSEDEHRDIRTRKQKLIAQVSTPSGSIIVAIMVVAAMGILPMLIEPIFVGGLLFFFWLSRRPFSLPMNMPRASGLKDPNGPSPKSPKEPGPANGVAFLGNEIDTNLELWVTADDLRQHFLVFGTTGAGKALRNKEWIHTPDGWRRNQTLKIGDRVSTPDGLSSPIVGIYPQGELDLMKVTFDDGRWIKVSEEHLWEVFPLDVPQGSAEVIDTNELHHRLLSGAMQGWAVPMTLPPDGPTVEIEGSLLRHADEVADALLNASPTLPDPLLRNASLAQRRQFWDRFVQHAAHVGLLRAFDEQQTFFVRHATVAQDLLFLARSMGHWATLETLSEPASPEFSAPPQARFLLTVRAETHLRVQSVERTDEREACQCIKIADPRGLFVTRDWIVTHNTETLISLAFNALVQGSGFIYVDGKGDNTLWAKIYAVARSLGRDDDVLVVNYMTGGRDVFGAQETKQSNTLNPFISGSSGGLTELLVGLMDEAGGDNAMWKGRAISLLSGIMMAIVWMRDNRGLLIDVDVLREYLLLERIEELAQQRDLPEYITQSIRAYLRSLPGYQENPKDGKQSETVLDQHGFLQMQFTRILGSLGETYGFIFKTNLGEVNFFDVVVNRRILVVLLPALEKSPDELGNLGKIIVACLKQMMATGLGDRLEGDYADVIEVKPTESPAPFMCILDEYGYYVVKGAAVMPAQARSLGFCMVFAGQDYPAFKKNNNAEEAVSTIGNCGIKIFMKIEDPTETFDLCKQSAGEGLVAKTGGYQISEGSSGYSDLKNASLERRSRVDWLDLKSQGPGQAHVTIRSALVRAQLFYAEPPTVQKLQLNHFLRVEPPSKNEIDQFDRNTQDLTRVLLNPNLVSDLLYSKDYLNEIAIATRTMSFMQERGASMRDAAAAVIAAQRKFAENELNDFRGSMNDLNAWQHQPQEEQINVFSTEHNDPAVDLDYDHAVDPLDLDDDAANPFIDREATQAGLEEVEIAAGTPPDQARHLAETMASDMQKASSYPRSPPDSVQPDAILDIIEDLNQDL